MAKERIETPDSTDPNLEDEFADLNIVTPDLSKCTSYENLLNNIITPDMSQYQSPHPATANPTQSISSIAPYSQLNQLPSQPNWYHSNNAESPGISMPNIPPHPHSFSNNSMSSPHYYSPSLPYPFPFSNHGSTHQYNPPPNPFNPQYPSGPPQHSQYYAPVYPQSSALPMPPTPRYNNSHREQQHFSNNYTPNNQQKEPVKRQYVRDNFRDKNEYKIESMSVLLLKNKVCDAMQTQDGSRYIQNNFNQLTTEERAELFKQVLQNDICKLSRHVFSNWVIQLIYQYASYSNCKLIVESLRGQIFALSTNTFGCRLIQKILSSENNSNNLVLKEMIITELRQKTLQCLRNNNGHHVIEKTLSHCPTTLSSFILQEIVPQLMALAVDPFGCQIIELILKKFTFDDRDVKELMVRITANISEMSRHRYGNYIVQDVIESSPLSIQDKMFKAIFEDIVELGCNKYSSNVVEKSIYLASNKRRRKLVRKIVNDDILHQKKLDSDDEDDEESYANICYKNDPKNQHTILRKLIFDKYGNYVIQTLLICSGRKDRQKLMDFIHGAFPNLEATPYGKHIMSAINKVQKNK